jgi:TetR/AcrR family transcriptional regulator
VSVVLGADMPNAKTKSQTSPAPKKKPKKRDADATRAAILHAAEIEFLEHGLRGTAVSTIAARAGVTKSLIHHHFGSKSNLWQTVKAERMAAYAAEQIVMLDSEPLDESLAIRSMVAYFRFLQETPEVIQLLCWMFIEQDDRDFGGIALQLVDSGIAKFAEGQRLGVIRADLDPRLILAAYLSLVQHWFQDRDFFAARFDSDTPKEQLDEAYLQAVLKIFLDGIRARET